MAEKETRRRGGERGIEVTETEAQRPRGPEVTETEAKVVVHRGLTFARWCRETIGRMSVVPTVRVLGAPSPRPRPALERDGGERDVGKRDVGDVWMAYAEGAPMLRLMDAGEGASWCEHAQEDWNCGDGAQAEVKAGGNEGFTGPILCCLGVSVSSSLEQVIVMWAHK